MSDATASGAAPDRWRTGMLIASALPLSAIALLLGWDLYHEFREFFADPESRAVSNAFWHLQLPVLVTLSHWLLASGVLLALARRRDVRRSRRTLLFAFGLSIPLQVLPHVAPFSWHFEITEDIREQADVLLAAAAPLAAVGMVIDLLPLLLSITVGLSRAGLRQVRLQPDDPVGGTIAFVASLQLGLVSAVCLCLLDAFPTGAALPIGLGLMTLHYAAAAVFCFALARARGGQVARRWKLGLHLSAFFVLLPGVVELLIGLLGLVVLDKHLIAWGEIDGHLQPGEVAVKLLVFTARSLVTALAAHDLLARASSSDRVAT